MCRHWLLLVCGLELIRRLLPRSHSCSQAPGQLLAAVPRDFHHSGGRQPGSASRVVVEPGLQVAWLCEIEQVFRQLLQLLQGQIN